MAISYCSRAGQIFSYTTGDSVPKGKCLYEGQIMTIEEAEQLGIEQGKRIEFRTTDSFWHLLVHFYKRYGEDRVREKAIEEELDPDQVVARVREMMYFKFTRKGIV